MCYIVINNLSNTSHLECVYVRRQPGAATSVLHNVSVGQTIVDTFPLMFNMTFNLVIFPSYPWQYPVMLPDSQRKELGMSSLD